jgi:hypothetical protein
MKFNYLCLRASILRSSIYHTYYLLRTIPVLLYRNAHGGDPDPDAAAVARCGLS